MLLALAFVIIHLVALEKSESVLIGTRSNIYIKNKLRNTKELLDKYFSSPYTHYNKNIITATRELHFNEINEKEIWKELCNKNLDANKCNFNDKSIFVKYVKILENLLDCKININMKKNWLSLKKIYLERGHIGLVSFEMREGIAVSLIINPVKLKNRIDFAAKKLSISEKYIFFKNEKGYFLSGDIIALNGVVNFQEISISSLRATYLREKKLEKLLISGTNQSFSTELRNLRNLIKDLQVSSICELDFEYWLRNHDKSDDNETDLNNINLNSCSIYNETAISFERERERDMYVNELNVNKINGIDIKNLLNSSFLLREIQVIRGDLIGVNLLRAVGLHVEKINNVSSSKLLNKVKNESVDESAIDRLEVYNLLVDKINEVTVSDAARMSEVNVIKGKVRIGSLLIRNEVKVKENVAVPLNNSMQVYEEAVIVGNLFVKSVQIESESCVMTFAFQEKQVCSSHVLEQSWRKSEEQMLLRNVRFEKGALINELECQYLNGLREQDFVYSASHTLQMENVTFGNVHLKRQLFNSQTRSAASAPAVEGFFNNLSSELIIFNKLIRFTHLSVDRIVLDNYNGLSINDIMQGPRHGLKNGPFKYLSNSIEIDFKILRATEQVFIRQLNMNWLNARNASGFEKAIISDKNLKVDKLEANVMKTKNVKINDFCGKNVEGGLLKQKLLIKSSGERLALTIAERLEVENSLSLIKCRLNEENVEYYINRMKSLHSDDVFERKRLKRMNVFKHLNAYNVLMKKLEDVFAEAFSISRRQAVPAASPELMAEHVKIDYLTSEKFNNITLSSLIHANTPCLIHGAKYFLSLVVKGNIKTNRVNGESAATAKAAGQLKISGAMLNNESVQIAGSVFWEDSSEDYSESVIKELYRYAVARSDDQSIDCSLVVEQAITIDYLAVANKKSSPFLLNKILETLSDCLIDRDDSTLKVKKVLLKKVKARDVKVSKDVKMQSIDHVHFDQMILQIFRKSDDKVTLAKLSFLEEMEIESLRTQSINAHKFALTDKRIMPSQLEFKHLIIERNVSLYKLDNLVFNEFITKRVNIADPCDILANVHFYHSIAVLQTCSITMLNGIRNKHLVLRSRKASAATTLIKGRKSFASILCIESNLDGISALTLDIIGIVDNTEIFRNLEIEEDVKSLRDIILLGRLNNAELELSGQGKIDKLSKILIREANAINQLAVLSTPTNKLAGCFFYLEKITNLNLHWLAGVQTVTSTTIDHSSTRLDVYTSETGTACGLPIDCPCRAHLLLEISSSGDHRVIQKTSNLLFNFYEPTALFGLMVLGEAVGSDEAVQSGEYCSRCEAKATTIYWTKLNAYGESKIEKLAVRIEGFIAHAQVFLINSDKLYMILAKFYDNTLRSYATDSLVYEYDLETKKVHKCQSIATEGAKAVHIFQVAKTNVFALIGCVKGKAESLLLRFDLMARQFQLVRTFTTGGSKHIASLTEENKSFVILSNPDIEALQIYIYNLASDNFYDYQNLYFQSRVSSLNAFYSEESARSKAYLTVTTKDGLFYIYHYTLSGKFKMKISYHIEDFQVLSPFRIGNQNYLFAAHRLNSTIFKVVQHNN